jgi:branched-chain amino acid aminotransferase
MEFDVDAMKISAEMKKHLLDYKEGKIEDVYHWLMKA